MNITPSASLPTSGPLGMREDYNPTNRDLMNNAYKQNEAINKFDGKVDDLHAKLNALTVRVDGHGKVIDQLESIKKISLYGASFLGVGGVIQVISSLKSWLHN